MATKTIEENPIIGDTILLEINTPDIYGCINDPYKVESLTIYFAERNYSDNRQEAYVNTTYQQEIEAKALAAAKNACENPTTENINKANDLRAESNNKSKSSLVYYQEAIPVKVVGSKLYPAWLSTDTDNALITKVEEDDDGDAVYGKFTYELETNGLLEGDYFVCWTWASLPASDLISDNYRFILKGNTKVNTAIPTHRTPEGKYEELLEKYLPDVFKMKLCDGDETPYVLEKFNASMAASFADAEDLANQLVDLLDPNAVRDQFLPLLANYVGIKLKTNDPVLWRRQIKNAFILNKRKGTKSALKEALLQAGIKLNNLKRLWQTVSKYTWQESFVYSDSNSFLLAKQAVLPIENDNFVLYLRTEGNSEYTEIPLDYIEIVNEDETSTLNWVGESLSISPMELQEGDIVRIIYKIKDVPSEEEQIIENYTRTLPLNDSRDETDQYYPLKNWNVRLIEEDDPLFNIIVSEKHPYSKDVIFGKVRTEFPYSENIYNMEEWNGSLRSSKKPCDIDREFLDSCSSCLSSKYNIDIEVENLSNDRILEAQEIIREYSPFHAVLNTMNFSGAINDYVETPVEEIEILVTYKGSESIISGEAQMWFNRAMKKGTTTSAIFRNELASSSLEYSGTGLCYNSHVTIYAPDINFSKLGIVEKQILDILAPSPNAGTYYLDNPNIHVADVDGVSEPINQTEFTFNLSHEIFNGTTSCNIYQDNIYKFEDLNQAFSSLQINTNWDIENNDTTGVWKILIPSLSLTAYELDNILPDGLLIIKDDGTLPTTETNDLSYQILDQDDNVVLEGTTGSLLITNRARVEVLTSGYEDVHNLIYPNSYFKYFSTDYKISGVLDDSENEFYIQDYDSGDAAGVDLIVHQRIVENGIGYFNYQGLNIEVTGVNLETDLGIQNGDNPISEDDWTENENKENFIIVINDESFLIDSINGDSGGDTVISLVGPDNYWKTHDAGGTNVSFEVYKYTKNDFTVSGQQFDLPEHEFRNYDRQGREIITYNIEDEEGNVGDDISALSAEESPSSEIQDFVKHEESISYKITYLDGTEEEGTI